MDDIKGFVLFVILCAMATSMLNVQILKSENAKLHTEIERLRYLNGKYVDQMSPLQKVQNDIYVPDSERDEYLDGVWRYQNTFGGAE